MALTQVGGTQVGITAKLVAEIEFRCECGLTMTVSRDSVNEKGRTIQRCRECDAAYYIGVFVMRDYSHERVKKPSTATLQRALISE